MTLRSFFFKRRHMKACRDLARDVERRRKSFETRDYVKRREAMLRVTRSRVSRCAGEAIRASLRETALVRASQSLLSWRFALQSGAQAQGAQFFARIGDGSTKVCRTGRDSSLNASPMTRLATSRLCSKHWPKPPIVC
jgi:hypothetical protein